MSWAKSGLLTLRQRAKPPGLQRGAAEEETRRSHKPVLERGLYMFGLYADFRRNGLSITYGTWMGPSTILTLCTENRWHLSRALTRSWRAHRLLSASRFEGDV